VDGRSKVTGAARYAAEFTATGLVHGAVVNATIARGKIAAIDAFYSTPTEFHQPMEMHGCTVVPSADGRYTVYEKTQGVSNTQ
ncbi:molybdopterin cofactor-binding domain-containing protein, partial [Paraburkholderia sp. EG287B]|uniref:molybdopterin cofactor-binding domain-containing protein n=1 Tax=unclassified Paraburkholderia TaxID=2615204 RepID=UPI0034D22342